MGGNGRVEVIKNKGCSRLFVDITSSSSLGNCSSRMKNLQIFEPANSPAYSSSSLQLYPNTDSNSPFFGLVICVTGLSKEAREQVKDATERLGGKYSPHLHPQCTHLVVQSSHGRKFEHALKHGLANGLYIVSLKWFVDSVRSNVRLRESLYGVKIVGENYMPVKDLSRHLTSNDNSCVPVGILEHSKQPNLSGRPEKCSGEEEIRRRRGSTLCGHSFYVDSEISSELQSKVVEAVSGEGAALVDRWFAGRNATHVVCEGPSMQKYIGHSNNLVTPLWVLKTAKEKRVQRVVQISADLARQVRIMLDNVQSGCDVKDCKEGNVSRNTENINIKGSVEQNQKLAELAKEGVRNRRDRRIQLNRTPIRPITPNILLDSICWSISEPPTSASIYTDSHRHRDLGEHQMSLLFDSNEDGKESETSFINCTRPLRESEESEVVFKNHFLTILFPVDRFSEMGPCSKTFFSGTGFTCLQLLDNLYAFYQENMSAQEIELAIHTDSRHADKLRSMYSSKEAAEGGFLEFKRIDFLGSRKSFEMLKRVNGDNNCNVYELFLRA